MIWQQFSGHIFKRQFVVLIHSLLDSYNHCTNATVLGYKTPRYTRRWPALLLPDYLGECQRRVLDR